MGTSVNQRSAAKGAWAAHHAALGRDAVPLARQAMEVWRSAFGDRGGKLSEELCAVEILEGARVASSSSGGRDATLRFESVLQSVDSGSIAVEFARRCVVRTASESRDPAQYGANLFAEAASYLVARDLPSFVGANGRVATTAAAIELKEAISSSARATALAVADSFPRDTLLTSKGWTSFVRATTKKLVGGANGE